VEILNAVKGIKMNKRTINLSIERKKELFKLFDDTQIEGCVPDEVLNSNLTELENKDLGDWLYGQTMTLRGPYVWDLERWVNGLPVID
jgi:hypothetical protein